MVLFVFLNIINKYLLKYIILFKIINYSILKKFQVINVQDRNRFKNLRIMLLNMKIKYFVLFKGIIDGYKFLVYIIVLCF